MNDQVVTYEGSDGIAVIRLNRPEALNALDDAVVEGLRRAFLRLNQSEERCAIVTGAGERAFSAGADMKIPPTDMSRCMPGVGVDVQKPLIAAIDGHCIGGGYVLAQNCDLAIATDRATFSYPEAQIGYAVGNILGCVARIPQKVAMEFMLLGERMTAERAYQGCMINKVVSPEKLMPAAMAWARILADSAPLVIAALRSTANAMIEKSPPEAAAMTRHVFQTIAESADRQEGMRAFAERRKPVFGGR